MVTAGDYMTSGRDAHLFSWCLQLGTQRDAVLILEFIHGAMTSAQTNKVLAGMWSDTHFCDVPRVKKGPPRCRIAQPNGIMLRDNMYSCQHLNCKNDSPVRDQ